MSSSLAPIPFLGVAFRRALILCWLALLGPWLRYGEQRDWACYLALLGVFPIWLWCRWPSTIPVNLRKTDPSALFFLSLLALANGILHVRGLPPYYAHWAWTLLKGAAWGGFDLGVTWGIARIFAARGGNSAHVWILFLLFYLVMQISDEGRPLAWVGFSFPVGYFILIVGIGLAAHHHTSLVSLSSYHRHFHLTDLFWVFFFLLWISQPVPLSGIVAHHYSFYLCPLQLVESGGRLLYDVPSQYGFLSILLPSWLPGGVEKKFFSTLSALLFFQCVLTYIVLKRNLPTVSGWSVAGPLSVVTVLLLPGSRETLGVLGYPSTGAYRFFWVYLLTLLLVRTRGHQPNSPKRIAATCITFTVGCLWSLESAFYCLSSLGACAVAEAGLGFAANRHRRMQLLARFGFPLASLVSAMVAVEFCYRFGFKHGPDWNAFFEYALAYGGGFGSLPMTPWGAFNSALCLFVVAKSYVLWNMRMRPSLSFASLFSIIGTFGATLTYYISRSHPQNICNLLGFWFPLFCVVAAQTVGKRQREWNRVFYSLIAVLAVVLVAIAIRDGKSLRDLPSKFFRIEVSAVPSHPLDSFIDSGLPLISLSSRLIPFENGVTYTPWLPIHPFEMFQILPPSRQKLYLDRFLERKTPLAGQILSGPEDPQTPLFSVLENDYQLKKEVPLPSGLKILTFEKKQGRP